MKPLRLLLYLALVNTRLHDESRMLPITISVERQPLGGVFGMTTFTKFASLVALHSYKTLGPFIAAVLMLTIGAVLQSHAQSVSDFDKDRGKVILSTIKADLKKHYYDPLYRGIDVDAHFKNAENKINQAASMGQILGIIAQALIDFDDSHTYFIPPPRPYRTEYGWQVQMIGDRAYVVAVKPESDAEAKGLKPGDEVLSVDGVALSRKNLWIFRYLYNALRPQPGMRLQIMKPDGKEQRVDVLAKIKQGKRVIDLTSSNDYMDLVRESENEDRLTRHRFKEFGEDLVIWKMPQFDLTSTQVDDAVNKFRKRSAVIIDLRGNGGGAEETLLRLIGNFFEREIKVGDLKRRKEVKPITAKSRNESAYKGKLIVLIDSDSGSASEAFARIIQMEKRGTVIGDTSAGAVMRAKSFDHQLGVDTVVPYGVTITDADVIMTDGKSLEHVGVVPDERKLPAAADLAARRDPVLAYAASLLGFSLTPEDAGKLFPIEWRR